MTRYVIRLIGPADVGVKNTIRAAGGSLKHDFSDWNTLAVDLPETAIKGLQNNPRVAYIEKDIIVHATDQVLDWGVDRIDADKVWGSYTGEGVDVAIIDTGIDMEHQDLNVVDGVTFVDGTTNFDDDNGHGTHCAGIVAALDNGYGVIGVAPDADLYGVKVLNYKGSGYATDVAAGILWAADYPVDIISMSLGSDGSSIDIENACIDAESAGVLIVAAAGNDYRNLRRDTVDYPAKYDSVIAVAATNEADERAYFSSTGPAVELAAPGFEIYSTYKDDGYETLSGTSMATPMVAGVAALVMEAEPGLDNEDVRERLQTTAEDLGAIGYDIEFGYGLVDAEKAVGEVTPSPNTAPVAYDQSVMTVEGTAVAITLTGSDVDGDTLTYSIVSGPTDGLLSGTAPNVTYTPNSGYVGSDSFTFIVNDGSLDSNIATVSIEVNDVSSIQTINVSTDVTILIKTAGRNTFVYAKATVIVESEVPVTGALVEGTWSDAALNTDSGITDTAGKVFLYSDKVKVTDNSPLPFTFTFVVDSVTMDGNTYTPSGDPYELIGGDPVSVDYTK
jgi:subtilisin family serine protease